MEVRTIFEKFWGGQVQSGQKVLFQDQASPTIARGPIQPHPGGRGNVPGIPILRRAARCKFGRFHCRKKDNIFHLSIPNDKGSPTVTEPTTIAVAQGVPFCHNDRFGRDQGHSHDHPGGVESRYGQVAKNTP